MIDQTQASGLERSTLVCVTLTLLLIALFVVVLLPQYLLWLLARRVRTLIGRDATSPPRLALVD